MDTNLFDLCLNRWQVILLSVIPAFINFGIFVYVLFTFAKSKVNTSFLFFVLLLGLWQLTEGFMRMSQNVEVANEWFRLSQMLLLFFIPFGILFILNYTKLNRKSKGNFIYALLFLPAIIFFLLVEAGLDEYTILQSGSWYWIANPKYITVTMTILSWTSLGAFLMLVLIWQHYRYCKQWGKNHSQALLMACGFSVPIIAGLLFEILLPALGMNDIPVTSPTITFFSVASLISISKYKTFDFSPRHQWDQIIKSMNEGIVIVDNDDKIMYANNTFCNLSEYQFSEIEGKKGFDLFSPNEQQKKKMQMIFEERKRDISNHYELQLLTKTGKIKWVLSSGSAYKDRENNVIGAIGIQTDITALKETEKSLRYNESRLTNAQAVAHVGSWEVNFESKKGTWSDEACRIYGVSPLEKHNQTLESWISFVHPEDREMAKKELDKSRSAMSDSSFTHRIVLKDGTIKHIHSVSKIEYNETGIPIGLFGICHDITEQVQTEKALRESEQNMGTFINESLMNIYFVDPETKKIVYSNPALSALLGYSSEELKNLTPYDFVNHSRENIDERMRAVMQNNKIIDGEREWKRKDGQIVYVLVNTFYHRRNGIDTIYVAGQDITERKKAEEKLKAINADLKTFIYRASHDLRGPLTSIMGLINVSKHELKEPASVKYFDMIDASTKKLDSTLLDLVKAMTLSDEKIFNDKINFDTLINELLERFEHFPGYKGLKIEKAISVTEPFISNRSIIETILQNLIENGIKYRKANDAESFLKINISDYDRGIKMIVEDNGIGIDSSIQGHIFDMYFRANNTVNGSGLGLYLVKKAVEKLNGSIDFESKPGSGTKFTVILPGR